MGHDGPGQLTTATGIVEHVARCNAEAAMPTGCVTGWMSVAVMSVAVLSVAVLSVAGMASDDRRANLGGQIPVAAGGKQA